jgi:phosphoribosylformylglycinamidine synthase PurS subunit
MEFEVLVQLKSEVLDPEARAIKDVLSSQGVSGIDGVTVAKRYVLVLRENEAEAEKKVEAIASEYLSNPVSQTYKIRRLSP